MPAYDRPDARAARDLLRLGLTYLPDDFPEMRMVVSSLVESLDRRIRTAALANRDSEGTDALPPVAEPCRGFHEPDCRCDRLAVLDAVLTTKGHSVNPSVPTPRRGDCRASYWPGDCATVDAAEFGPAHDRGEC